MGEEEEEKANKNEASVTFICHFIIIVNFFSKLYTS
jgi:hypothetical protein